MAERVFLTPVKAGSYVQAASLAYTFGKASLKKPVDEISAVSRVFEKAVDFVTEITPDLLNGRVVVVTEPKLILGLESRRLLDLEIVQKKANEPQPGDSLSGEAFIQTSAATDLKLQNIAKKLSLKGSARVPVETLAARAVLSAYADFQAAVSANSYNRVYVTSVKENRIDNSLPQKNLSRFGIKKNKI